MPRPIARYGMKYLAMAYKMAGGDTCRTVMKYQSGHMTEPHERCQPAHLLLRCAP